MTKGQITITWLLGLGASTLIFAFGSFMAADTKSQERDYDQIQRIARLEEQTKRIPIIESKVDVLLEKIGVNDKDIRKIEELSIIKSNLTQ